jgi:hypothetical protein
MIKFPCFKSDGSFEITAIFDEVTSKNQDIEIWFSDWTAAASPWRREWHAGGAIREETIRWDDSFVGAPMLESRDGSSIRVRFAGRPGAVFWKDWLVRLVTEFCKENQPARFVRFESK